jgi:ABC-type glutathione transport system ATPase component
VRLTLSVGDGKIANDLLLRVSRLTVDYVLSERAHRAVDDLSFRVAPGEVVGIESLP